VDDAERAFKGVSLYGRLESLRAWLVAEHLPRLERENPALPGASYICRALIAMLGGALLGEPVYVQDVEPFIRHAEEGGIARGCTGGDAYAHVRPEAVDLLVEWCKYLKSRPAGSQRGVLEELRDALATERAEAKYREDTRQLVRLTFLSAGRKDRKRMIRFFVAAAEMSGPEWWPRLLP
jgi:hypothetical protein